MTQVTSAPSTERTVRVAVLGCGTVGSALVGILQDAEDLAVQSGARLEVGGIAVTTPRVPGRRTIPAELITAEAAELVVDPSIDVVVELIGGLDPAGAAGPNGARSGQAGCHRQQGSAGLARRGGSARPGQEERVDLLYEAAVAGAIPLVRALRESLTGERIHRVMGIVNGTTNFILTKMAEQGADYADVLAEAQALGLAERDPTADVEGYDAAAKAAILAGVAFGYDVAGADVMREGITGIRTVDVEFAERFGYTVKLLAVVERTGDDALSVRVHPAMVPMSHPLGRGARRLQRRLHRRGGGGGAHALRPGGRGAAHGQRGGRRPHRCHPQPAGRHHRPLARSSAGPPAPRVGARRPVLREPRRNRPSRGAGHGDLRLFGDNQVSIRSMEQEGWARRSSPLVPHPPGPRGRSPRPPSRHSAAWTVERIGGVMRIVENGGA